MKMFHNIPSFFDGGRDSQVRSTRVDAHETLVQVLQKPYRIAVSYGFVLATNV